MLRGKRGLRFLFIFKFGGITLSMVVYLAANVIQTLLVPYYTTNQLLNVRMTKALSEVKIHPITVIPTIAYRINCFHK